MFMVSVLSLLSNPLSFCKDNAIFPIMKTRGPYLVAKQAGKNGKKPKGLKIRKKECVESRPMTGEYFHMALSRHKKGDAGSDNSDIGGRLHSLIVYKSIGTQLFPSL